MRLSKPSVLKRVLTFLTITTLLSIAHAQDEAAGISFDGLVPVEDANVAMAYINPTQTSVSSSESRYWIPMLRL